MNSNSFKDFIENRTVADIMEDYGEQRDEWETLLCVKEGNVERFKHSNGKTYFCEQTDEYPLDDIVLSKLQDKTIEQQMSYYYITEYRSLSETAYGEITKEHLSEKATNLSDYKGVLKLLLNGKFLVGALVEGYFKDGKLFLNNSVCTYYASDNEGSGTKDRSDYVYLIFSDR